MDFQTQKWVGEIMVAMVEGNPKTIIEPTPGEGQLVEVIALRYPDTKIIKFLPEFL